MNPLKKSAVNFLCLFIPNKKIRKTVRNKFGLKNRAQYESFREARNKKEILLKNRLKAETIFLGSSHVAHGFNPCFLSNTAFNLGSNSQDLKTSYEIYMALQPNLPKLKNIFLSYSVFSPGFDVQKTSGKFISDIFSTLYGFEYDYYQGNLKSREYFFELYKKQHQHKRNDNGYLYPEDISPDIIAVEKRTYSHLRENERNNLQNVYVKKFQDQVRNMDQKLYVVLMPASTGYKNILPESNVLFSDIRDMAIMENIDIIDFYNSTVFEDSDFCDHDHLNETGAKKMAEELKKVLQW